MKSYDPQEERAVLSALIQMTSSISVSSKGTAISLVTENASVSRAAYRMMKNRYDVNIETSVRRRMNLNKNLIYALKRPYRKNAKFIMNDATIAEVRKLKDKNGAYMWQPALTLAEPDRLMGYPIYTSAEIRLSHSETSPTTTSQTEARDPSRN